MSAAPPAGEERALALMVAANRAAVQATVCGWLVHDLRGPTQAISLLADLAEQGESTDDPSLRQILLGASRRLVDLVALFDRSIRPPEIRPAAPGPLSLRDMVELIVHLHRVSHSPARLDATAALEAPLPAVHATEPALLHVLLNLLLNAQEASTRADREAGTIRLAAGRGADPRFVELAVEDEGPGVPEEIRPRLFRPFATGKPEPHHPLAGLGLAVTRHLLEQLGGWIRYEPRERGARFVIGLRVSEA